MRLALAAGAIAALCLAIAANTDWFTTTPDPQLALAELVSRALP